MSEAELPHIEALDTPQPGILEQVEALKAQGQEDQLAAFEANSIALGAVIRQLALQEAELHEVYVSKPELVAQATDILRRLGLNKMAYGVEMSMRRTFVK